MPKHYVVLQDGIKYPIKPKTFSMHQYRVRVRSKSLTTGKFVEQPPCGSHYFEFTLSPTQDSIQPLLETELPEMTVVADGETYRFQGLSLQDWKRETNVLEYCGTLIVEE
jgi:hypothetical protein